MTDHPVILAFRTERSSWAAVPVGNTGERAADGRDLRHPHDRLSCSAVKAAAPTGKRVDDGRVITRPARDFDFHPDEEDVRLLTSRPDGVLRLSGDVYVSAARYGDIVLWHYAFARHWFKVNLTTDLTGQIVETGDEQSGR
jgi:hypothetical protein